MDLGAFIFEDSGDGGERGEGIGGDLGFGPGDFRKEGGFSLTPQVRAIVSKRCLG